MKPADIAAGYRKRADVWRLAAAKIRKNAAPKGEIVADLLAARWEARASQLDDDAEMYECQSRQQDASRHEIQPEN